MKLTNRHLAFVGLGIGAIGLYLEWDRLFPQGLKNPLATRPIGTTPATGRPAVSATQATAGRVSPTGTTTRGAGAGAPAGRSSQGSTLTLGSALTPIASFFGSLLGNKANTPSSRPPVAADKPSGGSSFGAGGGAPSSPGGSAGNVNAGRGAPFDSSNTSTSGGSSAAGSPYADEWGQVAYPDGNGNYQDEWGNTVYLDGDGHVTYEPTEAVGYVAGGEVFPGSFDPSDPSTFDYYSDGGPLAAPAPDSGWDFAPDGGPLADPDQSAFLAGDEYGSDLVPDLGAVDPAMFADDGTSDFGGDWGGGDGYVYDDNADFF